MSFVFGVVKTSEQLHTWVPHPRDVFVLVARVGYLESKPVLVILSKVHHA